jgi:hypothetical protein
LAGRLDGRRDCRKIGIRPFEIDASWQSPPIQETLRRCTDGKPTSYRQFAAGSFDIAFVHPEHSGNPSRLA